MSCKSNVVAVLWHTPQPSCVSNQGNESSTSGYGLCMFCGLTLVSAAANWLDIVILFSNTMILVSDRISGARREK